MKTFVINLKKSCGLRATFFAVPCGYETARGGGRIEFFVLDMEKKFIDTAPTLKVAAAVARGACAFRADEVSVV